MAVALDASMTAGNSADGLNQQASAATTISSTGITVGAGATLLVATLSFGLTVPTGVTMTWNGVSMTAGPSISDSSQTMSAIFYLINPASGAKTLSASWTGSTDCYMSAASFNGTDTTTGIKVSDSTTANTGTSLTVTSSTDGATVVNFADNAGTPTVNFTKIWAEAPLNPAGGGNFTLGGTSNAHTFTGGGGSAPSIVGVHILAAASGTVIFRELAPAPASGPQAGNLLSY
jgi:hypothetical protein